MKLLLDTHVVLWLLADNQRLGPGIRTVISEAAGGVYVSVICLWELKIKAGLGKLTLPEGFNRTVMDSGLSVIPVDSRHVDALDRLSWHHRDPFDRMLIAQALVEGLTLVSADRMIGLYDAPVLWS